MRSVQSFDMQDKDVVYAPVQYQSQIELLRRIDESAFEKQRLKVRGYKC